MIARPFIQASGDMSRSEHDPDMSRSEHDPTDFHMPWSTCNGLIRFMVIHPIIGILVLGVCVCGEGI